MRNEEKNKWKQKSSNLPLGIKAKVGLAVKVGAGGFGLPRVGYRLYLGRFGLHVLL